MTGRVSNNARIINNTIVLYIRMFFTLGISLYTSRVVLDILGTEDFGIYNIVGGVVVLFSFIQNALATATQRFLNYELGKEAHTKVKDIFSVSMTIHLLLAFVVFIFLETFGLWFFQSKIDIPIERYISAKYVYHFSVVTCCINIIRTPYNAIIIANEKMSFFAYTSIAESLAKLGIVYVLLIVQLDKLIVYSLLVFVITIVLFVVYRVFCRSRFGDICKYSFNFDVPLIKQILQFSGWSLLVALANVGSTQGANIILNNYVGVVVNAAMGIATQVSNAVYSFVSNFQLAYSPQIVKLYSSGNLNDLHTLILRTSKLSFFLLYFISFPLLVCCNEIMELWLVDIPEYAVSFTQITILSHLFDALSAPLWISIQATGKIKKYQLVTSTILLSILPLSMIALKIGASPIIVLLFKLLISVILYVVRIPFVAHRIALSLKRYFSSVVSPCLLVCIVSIPLPIYVHMKLSNSLINSIIVISVSVIVTGISIYLIGLEYDERHLLLKKLNFTKN